MCVQPEVQDSPQERIRSAGFAQNPNSKFTQSIKWEIFKGDASEPKTCWILHNFVQKTEALLHLWYIPVCAAAVWDIHLTWIQKTQSSMTNDFPTLIDHEQTIQTLKFIAANIVHYLSQGHFMFVSFNISPFSIHFRGSYCGEVTLITSLMSRLLKLHW